MDNNLVSIIITTKNEEGVIERLLKSAITQSFNNIEIMIVDNNSSDKSKKIAKRYTNKVFNKGPERSAQRNFGAKKAKGKYLLFLDADMELGKNVVEECVSLVGSNRNIGGVAIPETPIAKTFWEKVKAHERSIYNLEGDEVTDAARFFPKKVFGEVGGYDEQITGPEDWDLPEKIKGKGYMMGRIKSKILHYESIRSPFQVAKKKYYYALKSHRYLEKHNISPISAKTIYFLRPVFYRNWKMLLKKPVLTIALIFMLTLEQTAGAAGFIVGRIKNL